ncbi:MAG: hypothetical protein LBH22_09390 [Bacteroidales bacterium]|jgi:hypothetical protein|nr:hypothetical protein [Bacteroidales bacterium]
MNKKLFFIFALLMMCSNAIHAQLSRRATVDSIIQRYYNPERGFFQKAGFDKDNPRFMMENEDGSFKFGVGGFVNVLSQLDYGGIEDIDFVTSQIQIPTHRDPRFLISPYQTRFNFKVVGQDAKKRNVVAFIEAGYNGTNISLRHAYVSYAGFTIGQTWSAFMDLEADVSLIDGEGPNNQIGLRVPMVRYTYHSNKWDFSVAGEIGNYLFEFAEQQYGFYPQNQIIPNIPMHIKYRDKWGHVQLGAVFKMMNYGDSAANETVYVPGGGGSLSGTFNVWKGGLLCYQFIAGRGIGNYINDLSAFNYDLIPVPDEHGHMTMTTLEMYGGYVGLQHFWTPTLSSNVVYGTTYLKPPTLPSLPREEFTYGNLYNSAHYFAANLLWNFIPYGRIGVEYLFGKKTNLQGKSGINHRINVGVRYNF